MTTMMDIHEESGRHLAYQLIAVIKKLSHEILTILAMFDDLTKFW